MGLPSVKMTKRVSKSVRDNLSSIVLEDYGVGTTSDDTAAFLKVLNLSAGRKIVSRKGPALTINLPNAINWPDSFDIDLCGATVIAPRGFINSTIPYLRNYTAGAYFTTNKGGSTFTTPNGTNGEISINKPRMNGGAFFTIVRNTDATGMATTSLERLDIIGATGTVSGGVSVRGNTAQPFGAIGNITIDGELTCDVTSGVTTALLDVGSCASIGKVKTRGSFDWRAFSADSGSAINVGGTDVSVDISAGADFRFTRIQSDGGAIAISTASTTPAGRFAFDGAQLQHHYNSDVTKFAPGIYFNTPVVFSEEATFSGARLRNQNSTSAVSGQNIRIGATAHVAINLDGIDMNTDIANMTDTWNIPVGARRVGANITYNGSLGLTVDSQGNLYASSKPTTTSLPVNTLVKNSGAPPSNSYSWVYTGVTYGWCSVNFTHRLITGAPASAPSDIGARMTDTVNKHTYISVGTSSVADWKQVDN